MTATTRNPRKFMLHVKLSKNSNFIHDHELYEMMRSRQLYNIHKDLRKQLGRTIRGIENAERVHVANIEAQRHLFRQRIARKAKEKLKLTKIHRDPEDEFFRDPTERKCEYNHDSNRSALNTGVAGLIQLPDFVAKARITKCVEESVILPPVGEPGRVYNHPAPIQNQSWKMVQNNPMPDFDDRRGTIIPASEQTTPLDVYRSLRRSRLQTMREYTQLLDRRVQDFRL